MIIGITTVPQRHDAAQRLADQLHLFCHVVVSCDHDLRGPWFNWRRLVLGCLALRSSERVLVLQDDVILCPQFFERVLDVVRVCPHPLSLFTTRESLMEKARVLDVRLLAMLGLDTAQALCIPDWLCRQAIDWLDLNESSSQAKKEVWGVSIDRRLGAWSVAARRKFVVTFPNLVDHDVSMRSTLGHPSGNRRSRCFANNTDIVWGRVADSKMRVRI